MALSRHLVYSPEFAPPLPWGRKASEFVYHLDLLARLNALPELLQYTDLRPWRGNRDSDFELLAARESMTRDDFDERVARKQKAIGPWTAWFDAAEGLRVIESLTEILKREGFRQSIKVEPSFRAFLKKVPPELLEDLAQLAAGLRQAVEVGARFRIEDRWVAEEEPRPQARPANTLPPAEKPIDDKLWKLRAERVGSYLKSAAAGEAGIPEWGAWWRENEGDVRRLLGYHDHERLRRQKVTAARAIVRRERLPWKVSITTCGTTPALDEAGVVALETSLGLTFPGDYREFLLAHAAGQPQPGWFRLPQPEPWWWLLNHLHLLEHSEHPPEFVAIGQLWPQQATTSECLLLLKVAGDRTGSVWCWQDPVKKRRPAPIFAAESFAELMTRLEYPPQARPWMELIDRADVAGFSAWMSTGPDISARDPVSEYTPIEYAAGTYDPFAPLGDAVPEDAGLRRAAWEIVQQLHAAGATPGRALRRAFYARNLWTVDLLLPSGLQGLLDEDLADLRYSLHKEPSRAYPELVAPVNREIQRRKQA